MQAVKLQVPCKSLSLRYRVQRPVQRFSQIVKASKGPDFGEVLQNAKAPLAALCAAALLTGAVVPEEALAARTAGRVGGSSFSSRRAAPSAPSAGPSISNYNYYAPPPVVAPPLVGGFGFPGFFPSFGVTVVTPGFGIFSTLLQLFFVVFIFSFIFNAIKGLTNNKRYDD